MTIFVIGGTGFIGSHTVISLLQSGFDVVTLDNLCDLLAKILSCLQQTSGKFVPFYEGDIRDHEALWRIFAGHDIDSAIHFVGLKAIGESVAGPMEYYDNNVSGSLVLVEEMAWAGVFNIVLSSSATVYGDPGKVSYTEDMKPGDTTNPYGTSKAMVERALTDIQKADPRWSVILLRYFNPTGAYQSSLIGEHPNGTPNNLLPYICQVAGGKPSYLSVFGDDYPTPDGTGMRDYIHVVDLAEGHVAAMKAKSHVPGVHLPNLGSRRAYSVLEIVRAFEAVSGLTVPYQIKSHREGDLACVYADLTYTKQQTGWETKRDLIQMIEDVQCWVSRNPNGYGD